MGNTIVIILVAVISATIGFWLGIALNAIKNKQYEDKIIDLNNKVNKYENLTRMTLKQLDTKILDDDIYLDEFMEKLNGKNETKEVSKKPRKQNSKVSK